MNKFYLCKVVWSVVFANGSNVCLAVTGEGRSIAPDVIIPASIEPSDAILCP